MATLLELTGGDFVKKIELISRKSELKHPMKLLPPSELPKSRHSSLLLWMVLIMIMLSGIMYIVFKVKEKHALSASFKIQNPKNASNPHHAVMGSEHFLETLQSQHSLGQFTYKTKIILPDTASSAMNREALWQQGQKQLTLVQATVHVAVDLSELTEQSFTGKRAPPIVLPPAHIISVQVDNLTSYDTKTGLPSTVQLGLSMTSEQSQDVEMQIEHDLCASGILQTATEDARQRVVALLVSEHVSRAVTTTDSALCRKSAS